MEGKNIVFEVLRQVSIVKLYGTEMWWRYAKYFYARCLLETDNIFMDENKLSKCSKNIMLSVGIDDFALSEVMT